MKDIELVKGDVFHVEPGDLIVIRFADKLSDEDIKRAKATLESRVLEPLGLLGKVVAIILDGGATLDVVRPNGESKGETQ